MASVTVHPSDNPTPDVAVLLPGARYPVSAPLLYWCGMLLAERGWHVEGVDWTLDGEAEADPRAFVERHVVAAFDGAPRGGRRLVVAKSFGTFSLPWAVREGVPGVWLTPVLTDDRVVAALEAATSADLAIGGGGDPLWRADRVLGARARLETVPGANHALAIAGDARASLALQSRVLAVVARHLDLTDA